MTPLTKFQKEVVDKYTAVENPEIFKVEYRYKIHNAKEYNGDHCLTHLEQLLDCAEKFYKKVKKEFKCLENYKPKGYLDEQLKDDQIKIEESVSEAYSRVKKEEFERFMECEYLKFNIRTLEKEKWENR